MPYSRTGSRALFALEEWRTGWGQLQAGARIVMGRNSIYGGWSKALTNATWYETAARVEFRHGI